MLDLSPITASTSFAIDQLPIAHSDSLEPGDRLIVVAPEAREFIASRVLSARRDEERDTPLIARSGSGTRN